MIKKYIKPVIILLLVLIPLYVLTIKNKSEDTKDVEITEYKVKKGNIIVGFESEGSFITDIVEPSFISSGKITTINVEVGSEISKGALLATIESSEDYYSMLNAKATYDKAIATHHAFEASYKDMDKSNFSDDDYVNYNEQENQLREARRAAEALYNKASYSLSKSNLYSPIDGTVIDIYFNEGETVQNQNQSNPIMAILPKDKTSYVESFVEDLDISKVKVEMKTKFIPDSLENKEYTGVVSFVSPKGITDNNGLVTYKVRINLENNENLFDGFIGSVTYLSKSKENVLVIPNKAVRMIEGTQYVFKYPETDEKIMVVTGLTDGTNVEVIEGLTQNDTIAITE